MTRKQSFSWLAATLVAFAALAYAPTLGMPFVGDDYVFLDETRAASFRGLWSFRNVYAGWYRPWSRELHFWLLQRLAGSHEVYYRGLSVVLWLVILGLLAAIVSRLASPRVAVVATGMAASLSLWGTPLLWISGSQDLWMLVFALASLLLFIRGMRALAALPFALALLSKETSAALPAIFFAYLWLVERKRPARALAAAIPYVAIVVAWFVVHPTLGSRLFSKVPATRELELRPSLPMIVLRTALSVVNLESIPRPEEVSFQYVLRILASATALAGGTYVLLFHGCGKDEPESGTQNRDGVARFAVAWALIGWLPLTLPSIAWHAYYGCLGALGACFGIAIWLRHRPGLAVAIIATMSVLRGAQAATPSWDWGDEWYQRRAGNLLESIRSDFLRQHPTLPPHTRVFLGRIPNNIGLVAGQSAALRVWYGDSTLQAGYYSSYEPRAAGASAGPDLFFRFDSLQGMVEVRKGQEDVRAGLETNPEWESDHEKIAMLFLRSGDVESAAVEFEKLSLLPNRADAAGFAAVCRDVLGERARADSLAEASAFRLGLTRAQMDERLAQLKASFPARR